MKRASYVDSQGNPINYKYENKKGLLKLMLIFEIIFPIVIIGLIIFFCSQNSKCDSMYNIIKNSSKKYLEDNENLPDVDGESTTIQMGDLYSSQFLQSSQTNNTRCGGKVTVTKLKDDNYNYQVELSQCGACSLNERYKNTYSSWSKTYPSNKSLVYVKPYYNYYGRQINSTEWSDWLDTDELSTKASKYGVNLPEDTDLMPEVPKEGKIISVNKEERTMYRYRDKMWKWYDIVGDYSDFSSEQVAGYANKDEHSETYTEWSDYSQNYPEEKDYREIQSTTGKKYYYENKKGKKIYASNGDYLPQDEVDQQKYNQSDQDTVKLHRYRDKMWRWYNGQERQYSNLSGSKPDRYNYRDNGTETLGTYSSWSKDSSVDSTNSDYREEESKIMVRYAYVYEFLTDPILKKPVSKTEFVETVGMSVPDFALDDNYKIEVTYQYRYRIKK